ncbi:molybdopterin molybdenumtransferase MoeA [Rhodobacteraceae bacterium RKSG542]|uniref:molybdopterin molybdotransferase MoeA n=1 Tax=Pseudovibrio flavus TaxID=2529854 RepID=UPI0012BB96CB|nr:gephyrin-like molybdotransferase Glp [Pseudovibrio flavus]MTI16974.1 molybdopterin molybdenumtransferase MoeA [Pseudovibrio flavus]
MNNNSQSLTYTQALEHLRAQALSKQSEEEVPLISALGRIVSSDQVAHRNVPVADNSAMDGYAINAEAQSASGQRFPVVGQTFAGHPFDRRLTEGQAIRIFTGAPIPEGCRFVAPQEDCEAEDGFVTVTRAFDEDSNIRRCGEDVRAGDTLVSRGTLLKPQHIGALAADGLATVPVRTPLRVGLLSTGDELVRPGNLLESGQIYDSNTFLLFGLLSSLPVNVTDLGILPDERDVVRERLTALQGTFDVIITSGGAGKGDADIVGQVVGELGNIEFWELAIKPGRPFMFGSINGCNFIGLPGNPVAAVVSFLSFARPFLLARAGAPFTEAEPVLLPAGFAIAGRRPGRREFLRAKRRFDGAGGEFVEKYRHDGSAQISSLTFADGLVVLEETLTDVTKGDPVPFIPFSQVGL